MKEQLLQWRERRFSGLEPDEAKAEREALWEEALRAYAEGARTDLAALPTKKSAEAKVLLAAAMKASTSASNGWLAERLGMGKPASVSQFVRRLMADDDGRRACEELLSKVKV